MRDIEKDKMKERLDWAFEELKDRVEREKLSVTGEVIFVQACEMARTLFVRSEIAFSSKKE